MIRSATANVVGLLLLVLAVVVAGWATWALSPHLFALVVAGVAGLGGWRLIQVSPDQSEES